MADKEPDSQFAKASTIPDNPPKGSDNVTTYKESKDSSEFDVRIEFRRSRDETFDLNSRMEEVYRLWLDMPFQAMFRASKPGDAAVLAESDQFPKTAEEFKRFFQIAETAGTIFVGARIWAACPLSNMKRNPVFMDGLQKLKVWIHHHTYATLSMRGIGFLARTSPLIMWNGDVTQNLRDAASTPPSVLDTDEVPPFEVSRAMAADPQC